MSRLRQGLDKPRRTTLSIDADTHAALAWLRSHHSTARVSASRLLREAAADALAKQGMAVHRGEVITGAAKAKAIEDEFARRLNDH